MTKNSTSALEAELLEVQRTLGWMDLVIGNITDAVYVVDDESKLVFVNQYFSDMVGLPRVFLLGRVLTDVFFAKVKLDPNNQFLPGNSAINDGNGNHTDIYEWHHNDIERIFKVSSRFIDTIKQTVYIAKDITAEYELSVIKTNFINIASHQLRTPMTSIMTYSHMLHQGYGGELDDTQKQLANRIVISSERMISLIDDILLISRLQNGEDNLRKTDASLQQVFESLKIELDPKINEKDLIFKSAYSSIVKGVRCNKFLMHEILSNLLSNAIQYTPQGGKISVKAAVKESRVVIAISDSGIGIPEDYLPNIYDQFGRAENAFKMFNEGTGLGLYVVKIITDLIDGKIDCTSQLNKGTTFTVSFPINRN